MSYEWIWIPRRKVTPIATYILIALNVIIYIVSSIQNFFSSVSDEWVDQFAYIPVLLQKPVQWYRIVTSMFLHGDIFHVFFNMMFLYWFGKEIEQTIGIKKYLVLYLVSGLIAIIFHTSFTPITGPLTLIIPALGASGAISGLLGSYLMLYPRRKLSVCWFMFFIPLCFTTTSLFFLLFWFATQIIYGYLKFGGIAFFAHIGGFIAGILLIYLLKRKSLEYPRIATILSDYFKPEGLGSTGKIILIILLATVLIGSIYSTIYAKDSSSVYLVNITACIQKRCAEDQGIYTPINDESVVPSTDLPRIVFNRLLWTGIIKKNNLELDDISEYVPVSFVGNVYARGYGVKVYVSISGMGKYDENGVLTEFEGSIVTNEISITMWGMVRVGNRIDVDSVRVQSQDVAGRLGEIVVRPFAILSSAITLASIFIVKYKDRDIVEEEFLSQPPYTPWV